MIPPWMIDQLEEEERERQERERPSIHVPELPRERLTPPVEHAPARGVCIVDISPRDAGTIDI